MADARRIIELVFQGVDETSGAIAGVGSGLDKFASGLDKTLSPLNAITNGLIEFDSIVAGVAVGIGTLVGKLSGDFDQSFREISTLLDKGAKDVNGFRQQVLDFGSDSAFAFKQSTNAVYEALSANIAQGDSIQFVNDAQTLAISTLGDLDSTTKLLVSTLNGYSLSVDNAAHVSDVLFETVKLGQVRIPELAESLGRVTPIAHIAGLSLEELGAAMSVLTINGLNADEAATSLRALLSDIIKPASGAQLAAKALGLEFDTAALKSKGLVGFLQDLQEKTGGNATTLAKLIPNVRGLTGELILGADQAHKLNSFMGEFSDAQGVAAAAAEKTAGSINLLAQRMLNAAEGVAIQFGLPLIDNIGNIEKSVTSLFHALQDAIKNGLGDSVLTFIQSILQGIEDFVTRLAVVLPEALKAVDPSPIIEGLKRIAAAFTELFGGIDVTTTEGLAQAIQLVVDTMGTLETVTAGLLTGLKPLVDTFLAWAKNTNNLPEQTKFLAGELLGLAKTASEFVPVISKLSDVLKGLAAVIGGAAFLGNIATLTAAFSNPVTAVLALVAALGLGVGAYELFGKGSLDAANAVSNVGNSAKQAATNGLGPLAAHAAEAADAHGLLSAHAETSNDAIRKLIDSAHVATLGLQTHKGEVRDTADEYEKGQEKIDAAALRLIEFGKELGHNIPWADAAAQAQEGFDVVTQAVKTYDSATGEVITHSEKMIVNLNNTGDSAEKAADKTAKSAEKMALDWAKLDLEWEKIASQEREVIFKVSAEIAVAQIQAQAEQIKAAFESINTAIESTGSTLSSLAQTFSASQGGLGSTELKHILEEENARRAKAFDLQQKLVNAQVEYLQNLNSRLDDGSALINISSDGLEPELEAFMFKILERVQVEASRQGQSFLLGLPQG